MNRKVDPEVNPLNGHLDALNETAIKRCREKGQLWTGECQTTNDDFAISTATDVGAKLVNEDFVGVYQSNATGEFAIAIADGITGSLLAADAAQTACLFALQALADCEQWGAGAIVEANRKLLEVGDKIKAKLEVFRPQRFPMSIWNAAISSGQILQTTLTLIFIRENNLEICSIADGGMLSAKSNGKYQFQTFSEKCIGIGAFSSAHSTSSFVVEGFHRAAVFTDGLNELMSEADFQNHVVASGSAGSIAKAALDSYPEFIEDNISLCLIERLEK